MKLNISSKTNGKNIAKIYVLTNSNNISTLTLQTENYVLKNFFKNTNLEFKQFRNEDQVRVFLRRLRSDLEEILTVKTELID